MDSIANNVNDQTAVSIWQRTRPCPMCKVKCCEGTACIQCSTCLNWFHFECSNLSLKSFSDLLENPSKKSHICKLCKIKTHCAKCKCNLSNPNRSKYCVGCLDKICINCLSIETSQTKSAIYANKKTYFCLECSRDHFCNVCDKICVDGCIFCDSCHSWLHYKCTKLKKSQIISYAKTSKKYFCTLCLEQNIPFSTISTSNLCSLINNDQLVPGNHELDLSQKQVSTSCNLCLECNPECSSCTDNVCENNRRICDACLICSYVLDKCEFNRVYNEYVSKFQNLMSAIHFNARSLSKNLESITNLISDSNINFDIIGITETKLQIKSNADPSYLGIDETEFDISSVQIPGYEFSHTPTDLAFGGAGIYISHKLEFIRRHDFEFKIQSCETCFVELISQDNSRNVIVGIIYRHPHNNFDEFFYNLQSVCESILKDYHLIIMGDINIDVSIDTSITQAKTYQDILLGLDLKNLISRPTRITNTSETILDHVLTNLSYDSVRSGIVVSDITDHLPVFGLFNLPVKQRYFRPQYYRSFKSCKINTLSQVFSERVSLLNLPMVTELDPHDYLVKVINIINDSVDITFPQRKRSSKQLKKFKNPWITQGILNSIQKCHYLHYKAYLAKKDDDSIREYKTYKLQLVRSIEKAKELEKRNNFQRCAGDSTKTWKALNDFFKNKKINDAPNISLKDENDVIQSDPKKVANMLNSHFVQKRLNLSSKLPKTQKSIFESLGPRLEKNITSKPFEDDEIRSCVQDLKAKNEAKILKWLADKLVPVLKIIFNRFLDVGRYPNICKIGRVTPLFKGGVKLNPDNFRPITVLSQINQVFEKIIKARLTTYLNEINFLTDFQFGFRKNHSTSHGISYLNEKILTILQKKRLCAALFIDLRSAFDTIDPRILIAKLDHIGIRGNLLLVIQDYLNNRKQFVKNGDVESIILEVLIGVPQDSVLGPLLFIIYINDIVDSCNMSAALFADDAVFILEDKAVKSLEKNLNHNAKLLFDWLIANKLSLNFGKTKYMIFHNKQDPKTLKRIKKFRLNINKSNIKQVTEFKYLGIILDKDLNWKVHIDLLCTKLSKAAGMIYKLKGIAPISVIKMVYYSIVDSHLRYGITSYGSASSTALDRLISIQNKIIKYMKNSNETISHAYFRLKILNIHSLYKYEIIKLVYKMRCNVIPKVFKDFVHIPQHRYGTRSRIEGNYEIPQPNTERDKTSIKYQGSISWNSLPADLKNCNNKNKFFELLKVHLLESYQETCE